MCVDDSDYAQKFRAEFIQPSLPGFVAHSSYGTGILSSGCGLQQKLQVEVILVPLDRQAIVPDIG